MEMLGPYYKLALEGRTHQLMYGGKQTWWGGKSELGVPGVRKGSKGPVIHCEIDGRNVVHVRLVWIYWEPEKCHGTWRWRDWPIGVALPARAPEVQYD